MYISPTDVEIALLRIFTELKIPAGGQLNYSSLLKEWQKNRLRHTDLSLALNGLFRSQLLETRNTPEGRLIVLTAAGYARAGQQAKTRTLDWAQRVRMSLLQLLRVRRGSSRNQHRRLRLIDRVEPQL